MLFQPGLQNQSGEDGLQKHTFDSILKCEPDIKRDLFKNIVLAGGCTMFKGMQERMRKEITALAPSNMTPGVESPETANTPAGWVVPFFRKLRSSKICGSPRRTTTLLVSKLYTGNAFELQSCRAETATL